MRTSHDFDERRVKWSHKKYSSRMHLVMSFVRKTWPFLIITLAVFIFFWKTFLKGLFPIPADFIVGAYYPWLDYKWGYEVGVPIKNPLLSDVVSVIYPLKSYAADLLNAGRLPLWNPFMFGGYPLFANLQLGILSPTIIFYFFTPKIWAWTIQIIFQPLLAGLFTYLLLKNYGLEKLASAFGGLFYAFGAFSVIWLEWNAHSLVAAFIPLIILLTNKFIKTGRLLWGVLLAISLCFQIFSGYPQLVLFTLMALAVLMFFHRKELTRTKLLGLTVFIIAGVLLSAILTFPGLELVLNSQRSYEVLDSELIFLPWQNLITFLAPDYFGNPATGNYFGVGNYTLNAGYSGIIVLILALIGGLRFWKKKEVKFFVFLFLLTLLSSLPTPLAKFLFNLPGFSAASNTRVLVLANLALATLAGFGISSLLKREKVINLKVIFLPLAVLLLTLAWTANFGQRPSISLRNLVLPIVLVSTLVILILIREKLYKAKILNSLLVVIICLVAVAELFRYGWKYTPFSAAELVFPNTPVLTFFSGEEKPFRVSPGNVIPMNMWVPYNLESISGYDAAYPLWWARLHSVIDSNNPDNLAVSRYAPFEQYESPWFDLLNNKYLLVFNPIKPSDDASTYALFNKTEKNQKFEQVFQDKSVIIYENKNFLPRAFFVSDWEVLPYQESLSRLLDSDFPFAQKIIIPEPVDLEPSPNKNSNSVVSYQAYSATNSVIDLKAETDGLLFVSDTWYPGWKAYLDGVETSIIRANYAFRAIPVTEGAHTVEFFYKPFSLTMGKVTSTVTAFFLIGLIYYDQKTKSRRRTA